jgi:hypothetical protein
MVFSLWCIEKPELYKRNLFLLTQASIFYLLPVSATHLLTVVDAKMICWLFSSFLRSSRFFPFSLSSSCPLSSYASSGDLR